MAKDIPSWYHGRISGDDATRILTKIGQPGAFLLRDSQNMEGAYTLTVSCSVYESGRFVDVKNYRIAKNRLRGRKKFPSVKDLQKCIQEQEERRDGRPTSLAQPVERSEIEKWDSIDGNWREKFRVCEEEKDEQQKERQKKQKDSGNKNTLSQKLDPNGNGPFVEEGYNHTSKDITTPIREPGSQGYNEQTAFNSGIYFTTAGLIVPRNEIPKSCEVEDNKFDKPNEFNTGIYMPPNQAMDEDKKNAKRPKNHEACKSASSNETNLSNSGIYMSSSRATAKNKSGKNESSEASTGISMSPKQVKNKNEVDEMPEAREVGETTSVTKPNVLSSGIYMSAKQATGKHKDEMHQVLKDGESASVTKPNVSNTGIYMSPKQAKSSRE